MKLASQMAKALCSPLSWNFQRAFNHESFAHNRRKKNKNKNVCVINSATHVHFITSLSSYFHASLEWHRKIFIVSSFIVDLKKHITTLALVYFCLFFFYIEAKINFLKHIFPFYPTYLWIYDSVSWLRAVDGKKRKESGL